MSSRFPENQNSPPLLDHDASIKLSDLRYSGLHEHATSLADLLLRRTGSVWTRTMAREGAERAAKTVADIMGWDEGRLGDEVKAYLSRIDHLNTVRS